MGHEGGRVGAAGRMLEDGGINFDKAFGVHKVACSLPEFTTANHTLADLEVDVHIDIATAIALFFIGKAVATGEGAKRFRQKSNGVGKDGDFAGLALADEAGRLDEVAGVEEFDFFRAESPLGDLVGLFHKNLDFASIVAELKESELAEASYRDDTTGNRNSLAV